MSSYRISEQYDTKNAFGICCEKKSLSRNFLIAGRVLSINIGEWAKRLYIVKGVDGLVIVFSQLPAENYFFNARRIFSNGFNFSQ